MYNLPYHKAKNEEAISDLIKRYPFAFMTGCNSENQPIATQVPVFLEDQNGKKMLRGHIMKNTDHHKAFLQNENVLVVFTGHHTYVSGTWYSNPHTPSTWNYMSVHAKGIIRFLGDGELVDVLRKTSLYFEANNKASATVFDNLPNEYTQKLIKAVVAFEIEVKEMDSVFKLSQDRDKASYENIISKLKEQDESGKVIAAEMEKRKNDLYGE